VSPFSRKSHPNLYLPTAIGYFRKGVLKYAQKDYASALDLFQRSLHFDSYLADSLVAQSFTLFRMEHFQEASLCLSKLPLEISFVSKMKLPSEWKRVESREFFTLKSYYQCALYLFVSGAFKEALKRLNFNFQISRSHILSLDLKFKCLLELVSCQQDFRSVRMCGVHLKAHATKENMKSQMLTPAEELMVVRTIERHLKFCEGLT
jgi:tetratricopeptide (TPR) repeat protein